ncbi:hypothetical protein URS_1331 [Acinetobacter ursingii]|nr:hypothetical protein URS_1331 [Acinetobacter ursingii]
MIKAKGLFYVCTYHSTGKTRDITQKSNVDCRIHSIIAIFSHHYG